jgi:hypothetical protein
MLTKPCSLGEMSIFDRPGNKLRVFGQRLHAVTEGVGRVACGSGENPGCHKPTMWGWCTAPINMVMTCGWFTAFVKIMDVIYLM